MIKIKRPPKPRFGFNPALVTLDQKSTIVANLVLRVENTRYWRSRNHAMQKTLKHSMKLSRPRNDRTRRCEHIRNVNKRRWSTNHALHKN